MLIILTHPHSSKIIRAHGDAIADITKIIHSAFHPLTVTTLQMPRHIQVSTTVILAKKVDVVSIKYIRGTVLKYLYQSVIKQRLLVCIQLNQGNYLNHLDINSSSLTNPPFFMEVTIHTTTIILYFKIQS